MKNPATTALAVSTDLLDRAVGYTRGALVAVGPDLLHQATPCAGWDLLTLLEHMDDGMAALHEAVVDRDVPITPVHSGPGRQPLDSLRDRACELLAHWSRVGQDATVLVGGRPVPTSTVALAGSLEIVLHGWDVARACRSDHPIPESLASELLYAAVIFIEDEDRGVRFGPAARVPADASEAERLLAYAGRSSPAGSK